MLQCGCQKQEPHILKQGVSVMLFLSSCKKNGDFNFRIKAIYANKKQSRFLPACNANIQQTGVSCARD